MARKTLTEYASEFRQITDTNLLSAIAGTYPRWHPGMQEQICARLIKYRIKERADAERDKIDAALQTAGIKLDSVDYFGDGNFVVKVRDIITANIVAMPE